MSRLCERPGCSEPGAAEYGMVPEDLLFWIAPLSGSPIPGQGVLCRRHADAMSVPRGWTLDDRREEIPRLFKPRPATPSIGDASDGARRPRSRRASPAVEQLQIDGTGETPRPEGIADAAEAVVETKTGEPDASWEPSFDHSSDLDGLLEVSSPLLARAFRGTGRPRA